MPRPVIGGKGHAEILIKPVSQRQELWRITKMPLAEDCGGVALCLEQFSQRRLAVAQAGLRFRAERQVHAEPVWITTREQRAARGGANRLGDMKIPEDRAFIRHAVEVRRGVTFRAKLADVGVAHVVAEDDDDVWGHWLRLNRHAGTSCHQYQASKIFTEDAFHNESRRGG